MSRDPQCFKLESDYPCALQVFASPFPTIAALLYSILPLRLYFGVLVSTYSRFTTSLLQGWGRIQHLMKKEIVHVDAVCSCGRRRDRKSMTSKPIIHHPCARSPRAGLPSTSCRHDAIQFETHSQNQNQERYDNTSTLGLKEDQR